MRYISLIIFGTLLLNGQAIRANNQWTDIWALGRAGLTAEQKNDYATARRNFDAAVQKYPKAAVAYFNRGEFFLKHHEYDLAVKDFDTAVRLHPTEWNYCYLRAVTYGRLGRYDLALADFNRILSLHPSDEGRARLLNDRAWIEATCPDPRYRNGKQAVEDAKVAVRYGHGAKAAYLDTLAAAYAEMGDFDSAIKSEEQAIAAQTKTDKIPDANTPLNAYRQHQPYRMHLVSEKRTEQ